MATPGPSGRPVGNKKEHKDPQIKINLSGLKYQLHKTSYQVKLGTVVYLANAKKVLDPNENFSFTVTTEDPTAGKFGDIVYAFRHGEKTGTLKIQAKHKLSSTSCKIAVEDEDTTTATEILVKHKQELFIPKITQNDFIADSKNNFCIERYFKLFRDHPQRTNATCLEGLIICTNADLDDDAKALWNEIDAGVPNDSTTSLNSYISSLFQKTGGKCYQLKIHYKLAALARLLINAIKSKKQMVTWQRPLFKEYREALLDIIDCGSSSEDGTLFRFKAKFLNSASTISKPEYEAFRKEFEDQYRQEFKIVGCVWKNLEQKRVYVSKNFLLKGMNERNRDPSSDVFPEESMDELFKSFCDQFRLVCGTYNEQGLDEAIVEIWRNFDDAQLISNRLLQRVEQNIVTEKLVNTYYDWLKDTVVKPLESKDVIKCLENIEGILACMKLEPISGKLRKKVVGSPFRVSANALNSSELYEQVEHENFLDVAAFDIQFAATLLLDTLDCHLKKQNNTLLLTDTDFFMNLNIVKTILRCVEYPVNLVIICHEKFKEVLDILQKWKENILMDHSKSIFVIRKTGNISSDFKSFRICHLTEESRNWFLGESIPLCTTSILSSKIFQNNFQQLPIEEVIKLLDWGKEMEENNESSKKYREIEDIYVHRPWVDLESKHEAENIFWKKDTVLYKRIIESLQEGTSLSEITYCLKKEPNFIELFGKTNNAQEENEPIVGDGGKKVLILLGEAGVGKSTNLTWMAWHLRKRNPSFWVVRCNLSDNCTDFKVFIKNQNYGAGKVIDETEALRMLYKLVCSSLQVRQEMTEKFSKCLGLSDGKAIVNEDLIEDLGLSLNNSIQLLLFKEKFNSEELVLLLDGFDEIAPHYKEVVLNFLSYFELFKGVERLFLTSRPYGFKQQFEKAFKGPSFFQLKPLSLHDKGSILYKLTKEKWHGENIDDYVTDFYKSLCFMLLRSLGDISDVPLHLMMAVDILGERVYHNQKMSINFSTKTFIRKLLELIVDLSKASFIVEEFVKVKIRHLLYDKIGADKHVADRPEEMERFEKAIEEVKLLHGLLSFWVVFNIDERHSILSANEIRAGEDYKKKIHKGCEKTGIIHSSPNGRIKFIHKKFAEYFAAWWIVKRRIEENKQGEKNISSFQPLWDEDRKELRENIDTILAKSFPLHDSIIEKDWKRVESLLSTNPMLLYEKDDGNRTPFHLIALHYDFESGWPQCLPDSIKSHVMNTTDKLFGWTALDYAFHRDKPQLICYLLHHGASINVKVLFKQIVSSERNIVCNAAKYARYVMGYLSSNVIEYESHEACKKMKQFCDKVVASVDNETSANFEPMQDGNNKKGDDDDCSGRKIVEEIIVEDSVWMLESIIHRWAGRKHCVRMITKTFVNLDTESIDVLNYFMETDPSILKDDNLWDCIILSVKNNYNNEFKYFFDLYCSRTKIKGFQPCFIQSDLRWHDCTIQTEEDCYLIDYVENNIKHLISDFRHNICLSQLKIPTEILIDEQILSLLIICVGTVRSSMLKYLVETCKLNLCGGIVYSLAMITNILLSKISRERAIKLSTAYECLLNLASNISDDETNKMLRLAITSELFEFSKCLIERFKINFQAVDETNGWNVCHLCASNQRSILVEKPATGHSRPPSVDGDRTDLFRYMLAKETDMDCFRLIDKRGRSILHLAMENGQRGIVEHIVARRLGLNHINEIRNLTVHAIPNIIFCYGAIQEILKSVGEKWWHYKLICRLAKQIAKISLTNREESQELNCGRLVLQQDATELYQLAIKSRSLFLMYYLHREFPNAIPPLIYDAYWLMCTVDSLRSPDFLDVTKWLLNPNEVGKHDNLYEVAEKCDADGYDFSSVDLEELVKQVETILSANRSVEEVRKLKLLAVAVCLKRESMIRHLCESFNVNIDWKVLIDIMEIAHQSYTYEPGTKDEDGCAFEKPDFTQIYKYLFERISDLGEIDTEGRNVLHLATQNGLGCMAKLLIKHNKVNVTTTNEQNGWNIFHYYASRKSHWRCCYTENDELLTLITKRVLEITSDGFPLSSLTEDRTNKLKELCFNSEEGRKSVIHVAVEADNTDIAEYIIQTRLGFGLIDKHKIRNSDECSRFRECYDELSQIAAQLPFNAWLDYLFHRLAKSIHRFSPENIEHITGQEDVEGHIIEEACRSAIKYRSLITLEQLTVVCEDQTNQALGRSTSHDLVVCMMECIRRNRTSMFKVLVGHCRSLQGINPRVEEEFEVEENDNIDEGTINEKNITWPIINQFTEDVAMNREHLPLVILSVAYGRLSMTRYLVEMLQLAVNKSLIVLIMRVLEDLWDQNCKVATPVYEYLANRCKGKPNLLHLCAQAECWTMLKYLIKERKLDPNEVDSENGWNPGHYCVLDPNVKSGYKEFTWLVDQYNIDCLRVYDRKRRSILHYALENGYDRVVEYIINHRMGLIGDKQPWYEWDLEKIEKLIRELQQTIKSLPDNIPKQNHQIVHYVLDTVNFYLVNRTSANIGQIGYCLNDNERNKKNTDDTIEEDSVMMLGSVTQKDVKEKLFFELIRNSYFDLALKSKSVFVLAYFGASDSSFLQDEYLWECAAYASLKNYNIEFKYFLDPYCFRNEIKHFQPCSIQTDKAYYFNDYSKSAEIEKVCDYVFNICWANLGIPVKIMINENILSLLVLCVATIRPCMLRYMIDSCKLNLCACIVYSLAMITNHLFSKIQGGSENTGRENSCEGATKLCKVYDCLLDLASNISDVAANKMLRLAITSELFTFSKCLIERYNIDFQAADEVKCGNVFHLCVSDEHPICDQIVADGTRTPYVDGDKTNEPLTESTSRELFACMIECIRRNRSNLFKELIQRSCTTMRIENEYIDVKEDYNDEMAEELFIDEGNMNWSMITEEPLDESADLNFYHLKVLFLAVAYRRNDMIKCLIRRLQLKIEFRLIVKIINVFGALEFKYQMAMNPVVELLLQLSGEKANLLHLYACAGNRDMVRYLIDNRKFDPNEKNPDDEKTALHYSISDPLTDEDFENRLLLCEYLMKRTSLNRFDVVGKHFTDIVNAMVVTRRKKVQELSFKRKDGRKSLIQASIEEDNLDKVEYIICLKLNIDNIEIHEIMNADEYSNFRECYDYIDQIIEQLPFNNDFEKLLDKLAKPIDRFSRDNIKLTRDIDYVKVDVGIDSCRTAIKYRSVSTLENLIPEYKHHMYQPLPKDFIRPLFACLMECIRRKRSSLFKELLHLYGVAIGNPTKSGNKYPDEKDDVDDENEEELVTDENEIIWSLVTQEIIGEFVHFYNLKLLILSVAYGRNSMIKLLIKKLQLKIDFRLIVKIIRVFDALEIEDQMSMNPIFELLLQLSGGNAKLLHLYACAGNRNMVRYLTDCYNQDEVKFDPSETNPDDGMTALHYCVWEPTVDDESEERLFLFEYLMQITPVNCLDNVINAFSCKDEKLPNIFSLAMQNGHKKIVLSIIKHSLGIHFLGDLRLVCDLPKLEICINKIKQIIETESLRYDYNDMLNDLQERKSAISSWIEDHTVGND